MTTITDTAATASIDVAARELRLPAIRGHAGRLAEEAKRAKATYLGFLADTSEQHDHQPQGPTVTSNPDRKT